MRNIKELLKTEEGFDVHPLFSVEPVLSLKTLTENVLLITESYNLDLLINNRYAKFCWQ